MCQGCGLSQRNRTLKPAMRAVLYCSGGRLRLAIPLGTQGLGTVTSIERTMDYYFCNCYCCWDVGIAMGRATVRGLL